MMAAMQRRRIYSPRLYRNLCGLESAISAASYTAASTSGRTAWTRFLGESADNSAHDETFGKYRAREAAAQRTRPTEPAMLVARIRRCLSFTLPAGLDPVTAYESHC